jgi:hypothetical protein
MAPDGERQWRPSFRQNVLMRIANLEYVENLPSQSVADLRVISSGYQILDRKPVYKAGLNHVVESVEPRSASMLNSRLVAACAYYLCHEVIAEYRENQHETAPTALLELSRQCKGLMQRREDHRLVALLASLYGNYPRSPRDGVAAVTRAIGTAADRPSTVRENSAGQGVTPSLALTMAMSIANGIARIDIAKVLCVKLARLAESDGYQAIAELYSTLLTIGGSDDEYFYAVDAAANLTASLDDRDPAKRLAEFFTKNHERAWNRVAAEDQSEGSHYFREGMRHAREGDHALASEALDCAADRMEDTFRKASAGALSFVNRCYTFYNSRSFASHDLDSILVSLQTAASLPPEIIWT